jgi:hypothetical protein
LFCSTICFHRNIFPEECFKDKKFAGIKMKVLPAIEKSDFKSFPEVRLFQQWMEEGVLVALERNYLKSVVGS